MSKLTVTVSGMTCGHCASSIREEVGQIADVTAVDVELSSGKVTINSDGAIELDAVEKAVEEAGYQVVR
jgi:copper ion binding protein